MELPRTTVAVNLIFFSRKKIACFKALELQNSEAEFGVIERLKFSVFALELREPKACMDKASANLDTEYLCHVSFLTVKSDIFYPF